MAKNTGRRSRTAGQDGTSHMFLNSKSNGGSFGKPDMGFRYLHRRSKTAPGTQQHAVAFGLKFGYWPCHGGPFITIEFATHRIDMWYGTPSTEA